MSNQSARKQEFWKGLVLSLAAGAAGIGVTWPSLGPWFANQLKPSWTLPDPAFLAACAFISLCIGIPMGLLWTKRHEGHSQTVALRWFFVVTGLNFLWHAALFGGRSPGWGYAVSICFWLAVLAALWTGTKFVGRATLWTVLVLLWGTYTSTLNFHVFALNVLKPITEAMDRDPRNQDPRYVQKRKRPEIKGEAVQSESILSRPPSLDAPGAGESAGTHHSSH